MYIPHAFIFFIPCYSLFMGDLAKLGWQRMDVLVQEHGDDGVLHMVCDQVADGLSLSEISRVEGVPYSVLWKWLSDGSRMEAYRTALEARADKEVHETLEIADCATPEDIGVAKLRVDTRKWAASKWDRDRYGESSKVALDVRYQVDLAGALLEAEERRARLVKGETIDNETGAII